MILTDEKEHVQAIQSSVAPVCPHCGQDPASFKTLGPIQSGALLMVITYCGNEACRKVWNSAIVGTAEPRIVPGFNPQLGKA